MLQRSLDVTLVRMCQSFEDERRRAHEELTEREKELVFLATHDALTGLPNRTLILDRIEQTLSRARHNQEPVAALFVDLDRFKASTTRRPRSRRRAPRHHRRTAREVIRETGALGRLGGDEFVVSPRGTRSRRARAGRGTAARSLQEPFMWATRAVAWST